MKQPSTTPLRPFKYFATFAAFSACMVVGAGCADGPGPGPSPSPEGLVAVGWDLNAPATTIEDGADVPWVWGFQGGTMIRPQFIFPAESAVVAGSVVEIELEHQERVGAVSPVSEGFEVGRFAEEAWENEDGDIVVGPLDDQLAWTEITDTGFRLVASLETEGEAFELAADLTLYDASADDPPHACEEFGNVSPVDCSYVDLPGTVEIDAIVDDSAGTGCNDPILIEGHFVPDAAQSAAITACHVDSQAYSADAFEISQQTLHPKVERECAIAAGVVVGARLEGAFTVAVTGTCNPTPTLTVTADLTACACQ